MSLLPTDPKERKAIPIGTGVLDYFPLALAEVAKASVAGNKQHLKGEPLHWDRNKSTDDADALIRHFIERFEIDGDGVAVCGKLAWRALAVCEKILEERQEIERENAKLRVPMATTATAEGQMYWINGKQKTVK